MAQGVSGIAETDISIFGSIGFVSRQPFSIYSFRDFFKNCSLMINYF